MIFSMRIAVVLCAMALVPSDIVAVAAQESDHAFESISIRRNTTGGPILATMQGATYRATNMPIHRLILNAYEVREDELVGGPGWLKSDGFDVIAKAPVELTSASTRSMLRTLLKQRLGLALRSIQREADVYALKLARPDSRLGPDLYSVGDDCVDLDRLERILPSRARRPSNGAGPSFGAQCQTIDGVARAFERVLKTRVINETGLEGRWDFVVSYNSLQVAGGDTLPAGTRRNVLTEIQERPDLFTAVREQLGLELERRRAPIDVWMVESVHPPMEN
jgi:uncharacterized protein (TIGR03435 family)